MKLYYSPGACSLAAHIVLEEIGKPYELVPVLVHMGETSKPSFLSVNPKGRVPVLVDDEIITELPAILTYLSLSNIESNLLPADPVGVARAAVGDLVAVVALHHGQQAAARQETATAAPAAPMKAMASSSV